MSQPLRQAVQQVFRSLSIRAYRERPLATQHAVSGLHDPVTPPWLARSRFRIRSRPAPRTTLERYGCRCLDSGRSPDYFPSGLLRRGVDHLRDFSSGRDFPDDAIAVRSAGVCGAVEITLDIKDHIAVRPPPIVTTSEIVQVCVRPTTARMCQLENGTPPIRAVLEGRAIEITRRIHG